MYSLSLVLTTTAGPPPDDLNLLVPARDALIIIGAVLGAAVLLLLLLVLCCCCWNIQLRYYLIGYHCVTVQSSIMFGINYYSYTVLFYFYFRSQLGMYRHDEALINSQAEGLVVPNPIIDIKESEDGELFFAMRLLLQLSFCSCRFIWQSSIPHSKRNE